jgi:hypothetical protein
MRSRSVVSKQHQRRASNHTDLADFVTIPTSSDTEVVGDLLWTVLANQLGYEIPEHISMTSKTVLLLYLYAVFGIVSHT